MTIKLLANTPSWDWPENIAEILAAVLRDRTGDETGRLLAARMAGDSTVVDEDLVEILLAILHDPSESEEMRAQAALALGPVLELADIEEFDDPDGMPVSEETFGTIAESLRRLYFDSSLPKIIRRRILEAAVRAPQDWHQDAVRDAYRAPDPEWKLTAVFAMQYVRGFDREILEALESQDEDIAYEAVVAAGCAEVSEAWPHIEKLLTSRNTDKTLLLAAIEAAASVNPRRARRILVRFLDSREEDISEAASDAISMADM